MKQIDSITIVQLDKMAKSMYGSFVKGVVDIDKGLLVVDADMHVDEEQYLLENGSQQTSLWGINLHPDKFGTDNFIEFDSMVNIRPRQNNMSRGIDSEDVRTKIRSVINRIVNN